MTFKKRLIAGVSALGLALGGLALSTPPEANADHLRAYLWICNSPNSDGKIGLRDKPGGKTWGYNWDGDCNLIANDHGQGRVVLRQSYGLRSYQIGLDGKGYGKCYNVISGKESNPPNTPPNNRVHYRTFKFSNCYR